MLLNEFQKQHDKVESQEKTIAEQQEEIEALKARLNQVEAITARLDALEKVASNR